MRTLLVLPLLVALPLFAQPRLNVQGSGVDLFPPALPPALDQDEFGEPPVPPGPPDLALPAPENALPPPRPLTPEAMERELAQHGRWIPSPDYGRVWAPIDVAEDWKPYTEGSWVSTPNGWSFSSTAPWALTFHYGRWGYDASTVGWYWVPGTQWGPAWVTWRVTDDSVAWAPLPPRRAQGDVEASGWSAVAIRDLGRPLFTHLIAPQRLARIVSEGRPVASIDNVIAPRHRATPPRSYGRRPPPVP